MSLVSKIEIKIFKLSNMSYIFFFNFILLLKHIDDINLDVTFKLYDK